MKNENIVLSLVLIALLMISLFSVVPNSVQAQTNEIYPRDQNGEPKYEFHVEDDIYFKIAGGEEEHPYRVNLRNHLGEIADWVSITTDQTGDYESWDPHGFPPVPVSLESDLEDEGDDREWDHQLELYDEDAEEVVDTTNITIYENQDFEGHSEIYTLDEEGKETNYFQPHTMIWYEGRIIDQHGNPPVDEEEVYIEVRRRGTIYHDAYPDLDDEGFFGDSFHTTNLIEPGEDLHESYDIIVYDSDGEDEYTRHTFHLLQIEIDIEEGYTQEQDMDIRIESNYEEPVDIRIQNSTDEDEDYRVMSGAEWTDQEFQNELWTGEYTIPADEPDGTYYVVVYPTHSEDYEDSLEDEEFELKKYDLDATTDKGGYLPGETVEVHYTVERLVNGEEERGLEVEYRITYEDEDEEDIVGDSRTVPYGHFEFEVPRDIKVGTELDIDLWANDTEQDHPNHWDGSIHVGELRVEVDTDEDEYLPGQTVYVTADTYVSGDGSPVEGANVTVRLTHEGEREDWSESFALTDDSGQVVETIHLRTDLSAGLYDVNVTAEKFDMDDASEERIEIKEEIKTLDVLLDRDKYSYAPGETVNVSYEVTQQGEVVDANVKYEVFTERNDRVERVYEKGFATDGSIEFDVPENFNQERNLTIEVDAKIDQETTGSALMRIPVSELDLLLNADQTEYEGGETINFEYELVGDGVSESEFYKVLDDNNDIMEMDELEEYEFEFEIPEHPASSYDVVVEVVTSGGVRIEESIELRRVSRIQLEMSIETSSSYTTDVFEPGDEIEVRYKIRALGDAKIPDKITLWYSFLGTGQEDERIQTDSPEGTFKVEIPDEVSDGTYYLQVSSEETTAVNMEPVSVEEDPSVWGLRVIGSLSLLGLLAIILLLIILGIGYYTLSSPGTGIGFSKISAIFKNDEEEGEEEETPLEPDEKAPESEKEELSPAEEAHAWKGPEEKESGQVEEPEKGPEDSDQIEPDDDL